MGAGTQSGVDVPPVTTTTEAGMQSDGDDDASLHLEWLFDPDRIDHLPISEQLKHYAARDLRVGKLYNIGQRLFGESPPRKRVIYADTTSPSPSPPPPPQPPTHQLQTSTEVSTQSLSTFWLDTVPSTRAVSTVPTAMSEGLHQWVTARKGLRRQLDGMALSEFWLRYKVGRTAIEQRLLESMRAERTRVPPPRPVNEEQPLEAVLPTKTPQIKRPSPLAIQAIENYLRKNKMRLIDLFACVDKEKKWLVSREDFKKALNAAKISLSEVLLEDLISTLDKDLDNELDYRELAAGMGLWATEKRSTKKKMINAITYRKSPRLHSQWAGFEAPDYRSLPGSLLLGAGARPPSAPRVKSAISLMSSVSSTTAITTQLQVPRFDDKSEQMILSSDEAMVDLRKHDREALPRNLAEKRRKMKRSSSRSGSSQSSRESPIIRTGDPIYDQHLLPSTLGGELSGSVNLLHQEALIDYEAVLKLCKKRKVVLSESLIRRALLCPPETTHQNLRSKLTDPHYKYLLSRNPRNPAHILRLAALVPGISVPAATSTSIETVKSRKTKKAKSQIRKTTVTPVIDVSAAYDEDNDVGKISPRPSSGSSSQSESKLNVSLSFRCESKILDPATEKSEEVAVTKSVGVMKRPSVLQQSAVPRSSKPSIPRASKKVSSSHQQFTMRLRTKDSWMRNIEAASSAKAKSVRGVASNRVSSTVGSFKRREKEQLEKITNASTRTAQVHRNLHDFLKMEQTISAESGFKRREKEVPGTAGASNQTARVQKNRLDSLTIKPTNSEEGGTTGRGKRQEVAPTNVVDEPFQRIVSAQRDQLLARRSKETNKMMASYPLSRKKGNIQVLDLSTGNAQVAAKVDCWLTFEQFQRLVRDIPGQYIPLTSKSSSEAFWTHNVYSRVRLCLDDPEAPDPATPLFQCVGRDRRACRTQPQLAHSHRIHSLIQY